MDEQYNELKDVLPKTTSTEKIFVELFITGIKERDQNIRYVINNYNDKDLKATLVIKRHNNNQIIAEKQIDLKLSAN